MKVEQLSIFLENKAGRMAEVTTTLAEAGINIKALSLADTSEFGILRLIVDKIEEAQTLLKNKGFTVGRTGVVAVEISNTPGGLDKILRILEKQSINVEYMYGVPCQSAEAVLIFRFDRSELAVDVLRQNGIRLFTPADLRLV